MARVKLVPFPVSADFLFWENKNIFLFATSADKARCSVAFGARLRPRPKHRTGWYTLLQTHKVRSRPS
jgi:hypothetical protein